MNEEARRRLANDPPPWMYEFDLGDGIPTPLIAQELRSVHQTRETLIFPLLDRLYPAGLEGTDCLDVACNEGYFGHLLVRRGARVKGIDVREVNIRRARAVQEVLGLPREKLSFEVADFLDWNDAPGKYEVSLFLGILYHLDNPMGALRSLRRLTRTLAIVETQFTRQRGPIVTGYGQTGVTRQTMAGLAVLVEEDKDVNNLAAHGTLSFLPNPEAAALMLHAAGFSHVARVEARPGLNPQYVDGDRGVFFAWV